jgi:hypothetical protein
MGKKIDTNHAAQVQESNIPSRDAKAATHALDPAPGPGVPPYNLAAALEGLVLSRPPKFPVGTTVPERVYQALTRHQEGISHFIETAISSFDGDMRALVIAANGLAEERRAARFDTGIRSISGRVSKAALTKLQLLVAALKDAPGMSMAKILGGLIQLHLREPRH